MRAILILALALAACGEPLSNASSDTNGSNLADTVTAEAVPVRIGELGANFNACGQAGSTRHLQPGESLPVRSSPFDNGDRTGAIAAGAQFFVCTRSIDEKWLGIVFSPDGKLAESCGVSEPAPAKGAYSGPCRSGWVASAYVKLIAGDTSPPAVNQASPAPASAR